MCNIKKKLTIAKVCLHLVVLQPVQPVTLHIVHPPTNPNKSYVINIYFQTCKGRFNVDQKTLQTLVCNS